MKEYKNADVLEKLYCEKEMNQKEIADKFDVCAATINNWIKKHGIKKKKPEYRDAEVLNKLYHEKEMSQHEIADKFGVSRGGITYWMEKHDIETRKSPNEKLPSYKEHTEGYRVWQHGDGKEKQTVLTHRLLAVSEFGFDAVCDKIVHHKNGYKFDNRPENIELMTQSEHAKLHNKKRANNN